MTYKYTLTFLLLVFFTEAMTAQIGGLNIYEFLRLSPSARVTGLGGSTIFIADDDISLGYENPAVLNAAMHQQLGFSHMFHVAGVGSGYATYGHHLSGPGLTLHGGVHYIKYGNFKQADLFGNITGQFDAAEYAINIGAGRQLYEKLSVGVNMKYISSQLGPYKSSGLAADIGLLYADTAKNFTAALVFQNAGIQMLKYSEGEREDLPYEIQFAISKKLRHLPLRFSITGIHLERWNILYDDPNSEEESLLLLGDETPPGESKIAPHIDNFFRHLVFAGEFLFGKKENFRIRVAYSHLKRKELAVKNFRSLAGFSMGLGFKISKFRLEFGKSFYHLAGSNTHLSLNLDLKWVKRGQRS